MSSAQYQVVFLADCDLFWLREGVSHAAFLTSSLGPIGSGMVGDDLVFKQLRYQGRYYT